MSVSLQPDKNTTPYKNYLAMGAIGVGFLAVSALIVRRAMSEHRAAIAAYQDQVRAIDPARVQQWHRAVQYEQLCTEIRSEFLCERLVPQHFTDSSGVTKTTILPQPYWCPDLTPEEVLDQLKANPALTRAASNAEITIEEACRQIISGEIVEAGPSPLLSPPTRLAPTLKAAVFISTAGTFSTWGINRVRPKKAVKS